ncbi:uncharacterized [Tachysurus ichikawai]
MMFPQRAQPKSVSVNIAGVTETRSPLDSQRLRSCRPAGPRTYTHTPKALYVAYIIQSKASFQLRCRSLMSRPVL